MKWYALRVINGKEKKVKEFLDKLVSSNNLKDIVNNIILPVNKVYKIRKGKKYLIDKNFYPGYLLIEMDINGEIQHIIEKTSDVIGFLKDGKKTATPLRKNEVERILHQIDDSKSVEIDVPFVNGEFVNITNGPFESFNGNITEIDNNKKRVKVNVKIFGRNTPVELEFHQIMKI